MFAVHTTFIHVDVVCPVQEPGHPVKTRHLHKSGVSPYSPPPLACWAIPRNLRSHENITIQLKRKTSLSRNSYNLVLSSDLAGLENFSDHLEGVTNDHVNHIQDQPHTQTSPSPTNVS